MRRLELSTTVLLLSLASLGCHELPLDQLDRLDLGSSANALLAGPRISSTETNLAPAGDDLHSVTHAQPCPDPSLELPPSAEMCPPQRQVGLFVGDCPPAPAPWTVAPLAAPLQHHCRYIWTGAGAPDLGALPANVMSAVGPDCRMLPQSPLRTDLADDYEAAFAQGTQPLAGTLLLGGGHPVEVAVVDTAPRTSSAGQAAHGPALAALVARLAEGCVPGLGAVSSCKREVKTYLGLPQTVAQGPDYVRGGHFGYQSDLAEGIAAALDGWTYKDRRLIINLAVGWEPSLGDLDGSGTEKGGLAAVRDALGLAHCQGALVVAASGNQPRNSCVDEPTGPGSWERQRAWTKAECAALGLPSTALRLGTAAYSPFVFAATPVDWSAHNLADFRPGSNARLAALGFSGYDTRAGRHIGLDYGPLTGSSVSTAAISGIAALVWSYFPTLEADQLMQLIYDSGHTRHQDGVTVVASHSLSGPTGAPRQHLVSACGALVYACDRAGLNAPSQCTDARSRCASYSTTRVDVPAWWRGFEDALTQLPSSARVDVNGPQWTAYACETCGQPSPAKLPRQQQISPDHMPDPWILPQPEKPPCPICQIKGSDLYLTLDPVYDNAVNASNNVSTSPDYVALNNVSVYLYDAAGTNEVLHYGVPSPALAATTMQVISDLELATVGTGTQGTAPISAYVVMHFTNGVGERVVVGNELPVEP